MRARSPFGTDGAVAPPGKLHLGCQFRVSKAPVSGCGLKPPNGPKNDFSALSFFLSSHGGNVLILFQCAIKINLTRARSADMFFSQYTLFHILGTSSDHIGKCEFLTAMNSLPLHRGLLVYSPSKADLDPGCADSMSRRVPHIIPMSIRERTRQCFRRSVSPP